MSITNADWFGMFGEVGLSAFTEHERTVVTFLPPTPGQIRTYVKLYAKRDGKSVEVVLDRARARYIVDELVDIFEMQDETTARQVWELTKKLHNAIELKRILGESNVDVQCDNIKLQAENEKLRKVAQWPSSKCCGEKEFEITYEYPCAGFTISGVQIDGVVRPVKITNMECIASDGAEYKIQIDGVGMLNSRRSLVVAKVLYEQPLFASELQALSVTVVGPPPKYTQPKFKFRYRWTYDP